MGILFAVINAILLGAANLLLKRSFKSLSPSISFFIFSIFSLFGWGGLGFLLGVDFQNVLFGFFVGVVSAILGQAIYIYVLSKGELSITATILSSFSIYTIIFSMIFNNERPAQLALVFIGLAILGTLIVSFPEKGKFNKKDLKQVGLISLAVFAAVCIGASDTLAKYYINTTSVGSFLFYTAIAQVLVSLVYLKIEKEPLAQFGNILNKLDEYKFALLGSLSISVSTMFLFLAFNFALASVVSPIAAINPVLTVLLALIFLKERISFKNGVGLVMVLVAILGISFAST